jgi:flavin-dependent dehydrogenase
MMAASLRDVVVVGAGPAGSVAGAYLARAGMRPLILEKERFPRFAIGESLLPYGNEILKELGVWPELERGGFVKKYGADFCTGCNERFNRYWFRRVFGEAQEYTFQVDRARFDHLLMNRARTEGCEVVEGARVVSVKRGEDGKVFIGYEDPEGTHTIAARWLVDASGRSGVAGAVLDWPRRATRDRKMVAVYGHFRRVARNGGEAAGHTVIVRFKEGWFWLIPLANDTTSVGAVVPPELLRSHGGLEAAFQACVNANPEVATRMAKAETLVPLRATADYSWRHASFAQDRILLTGDAAGFVDPIFSSGVMLAMKSGRLAARTIQKHEALGRGLTPREGRAYTREIAAWMKLYSRIIRSFYDRAGFEIFMNPMPVLGIPRSIGLVVGGKMDLPLAQHARIALFGLICAAQRVLRIVPPIPSLR